MGRLIIAAIGVAGGASLAVLSLAAKPVEVLKKAPTAEEIASGKVLYQAGERDGNRGRGWSAKRKAIFGGQPGVYTFTEEELNAWFSGALRTPPPANPKAPKPDVVGEGINFRVADGLVQLGLPVQLNYFAEPMRVIVQAKGVFSSVEGRWCFEPREIWIGSLPAHRLPGFVSYVMSRQLDETWVPADALAAWKRVGEMAIDDRAILVRVD